VKWRMCTRPRKWGGLGIKDLERYGRALRLRWLWKNWDDSDRPWKLLSARCDQADRALFFTSTVISVGNGKKTPFWEARWLNDVSPNELAPHLYSQARYKFRSVQVELTNRNWIKNLKQVNTEVLMDEFILLCSTLNEVQLNQDNDAISWKWTASGEYSTTSVYEVHFLGAYPRFRTLAIWRARTEPKCQFFAWLALLSKTPTTDILIKKNWPCDPLCALCFCMNETCDHILTECNFAEAVWDKIAEIFQVHQSLLQFQKGSVANWIVLLGQLPSKQQQRTDVGIIFFFWWFIWKERNHRIFEHKECSSLQVVEQNKDAILAYRRAHLLQ
jgi:hypothetical protein